MLYRDKIIIVRIKEDDKLKDDFHTYATEWDSNEVRFYFDGKLYHIEQRNGEDWPFDKPMYLILNLAIGDGSGEQQEVYDSIFLIIDYARVYDLQ